MKTLLAKRVGALAIFLSLSVPPGMDNFAAGTVEERHTVLLDSSLADFPNKRMMLMTVDYLPGQSSAPHTHPGPVIAYVLDGEVVSQFEGHEATIYRKGQSWFEPAFTHHLVSRNASSKKPATLLVFAVIGQDESIKSPIPQVKMSTPTTEALVRRPMM